jgi:DNA-binding SARP family transcriptional activator
VELGVLGPVELVREGELVALGGLKQRLALGLLTARRGGVVPVDDLIDGIWPEGSPVRPRKTVQVYVTRLRRALGPCADAIRSEAAGYRLDPSVLPVDADAFESDVRVAMSESSVEGVVAGLRAALGRWRGDAFVDLRDCAAIVPSAVSLDERRLATMYELFDREVRVRPREVLAELERAVEANPLHEGFVSQLMTAQYRSGRQNDALTTYQRLRRRLIEVGLETGPSIRELEARIIRHELDVLPHPDLVHPDLQRRRVTVVAAEIAVESSGGLPVDPEEELAVAASVRRAVKGRFVDRGGVVLADVGGELSVCFGYPAGEDSAERAVAAALAARDVAAAADPRVSVRVGADTGVVVVEGWGPGEGDHGELSGIAGPVLRSAAQLRALADAGEVRLGPATAVAVEERFVVERRDAATLVAVKRLERDPPQPGADGLFGRRDNLAELAAIAERAHSRLCTVLIAGPPGVGKSALVAAFVGGLDGSWSTVRVHCDARQSTTPLDPFRRTFPELFDGDSEPSTWQIVRRLQHCWADHRPVLVVEDVHDVDPSTRDVIDELPDWLPAGLVVMTSRSSSPLQVRGDVVPSVALAPLDRATARALAKVRAGSRRLRSETLNEIAIRSGGIPLHVLALTDATVADRASSRGGPIAPVRVPDSLYDSLMARLDRLGPARALAQRCAVLGDPFSSDDVAMIGDNELDGGGEQFATLVRAGVLVAEDGRYRFAHALLAQAAYDSLLNADRVALHARIADALPVAAARSEPERLAYHLEMSGRRFEGAVAWRRASGRAVRGARLLEAQQHARRAVALFDETGPAGWSDNGDNRRWALTNLALSLGASTHGSAELAAVIEDARRSGVGCGDLVAAMNVGVTDIMNRSALGDFRGATDAARLLLDTARRERNEQAVALAHEYLGATLVWRGELAEGAVELQQEAQYWEGDVDAGVYVLRSPIPMWSMLALAAAFADRFDEADRMFEHARSKLAPDNAYRQCMLGSMVALVDQLAGRVGKVRHDIEPLWSLATELGSDFWVTWTQVLLGWAVADQDGPSGLALMVEAIDTSITRQLMPYAHYLLGSRLCEHGHVTEGLARLAGGVALAKETGEELWLPLLQLERGRWLDVEGDVAGAAAARTDAVARATATGADLIVRRAANG